MTYLTQSTSEPPITPTSAPQFQLTLCNPGLNRCLRRFRRLRKTYLLECNKDYCTTQDERLGDFKPAGTSVIGPMGAEELIMVEGWLKSTYILTSLAR